MEIICSNIYQDSQGKNILIDDYSVPGIEQGLDVLNTPEKIATVMNHVFRLSEKAEEYAYLIGMNVNMKPIRFFEMSHGICNCALVGIRELFIRALLCGSKTIVVVHNHPSGSVEPSKEDIELTGRIAGASSLLGLTFCDHLILSAGTYYSFLEHGLIPKAGKIEWSQ